MIKFSSLRHAFPENNGLLIERENGLEEYTFLHFFQSVRIYYKGEIIETCPGAVIIYNKGTPQYFEINSPLVHNWMHFSGNIYPILKENGLEFDTIYYPENSGFITELVYELEAEFYGNHKNKDNLLQIKFQELIIKLGRAVSGDSIPYFGKGVKEKFQLLRGKMFFSLDEKWTTERMANEVGFSTSRFYVLYKSIFNITPTEDLINARISKAKNMLYFEKKNVKEIASSLGYENTTHFIRQFKAKTGLTPTSYRKSNN